MHHLSLSPKKSQNIMVMPWLNASPLSLSPKKSQNIMV